MDSNVQGVDWRDARTSACNGNRNPIQQDFYDGINADPLEVLFIKVKASMRQAGWGHVTKARALARSTTASRPRPCPVPCQNRIATGVQRTLARSR